MPVHIGPSFGVDLAREAVQQLAEKARTCEHSPQPPDKRGWGTPDWREGSAYPAPDEFDDLEYRWEFLRRRHGYRLDWLRPDTDFHPTSKQQYFDIVYELQIPFDPRLSIRDLAATISASARRGSKAFFEYPVSGLVPFRRALLTSLFALYPELERIIPTSPSRDDVFVRFDLGQPIKPQLEQIGYLLDMLRAEAYGAEAARMQKQLWPTYLRLLDAKDAGASLAEMAKVLSRHGEHTPQRSRASLLAAEELRRDWRY